MSEIERLKWLHGKLTEQIDKEFDLLGQRMTWLIAGNAFLFSAFFIGLGIRQSTVGAIDKFLSDEQTFQVVLHPFEKLVALSGIIFLGLFLCYASFVSMAAARQVIKEMKLVRQKRETDLQVSMHFKFLITVPYREGVDDRDGKHDLGNILHKHLPRVIAVVWCILSIVAISAVFGGTLGATLALVLFIAEIFVYWKYVGPHVEKIVTSIKRDYSKSVEIFTSQSNSDDA